MDKDSLKLYCLNTLTILLSFTNLENILKIMLLCISIVYTSMKIIDWVNFKIKGKNVNNDKETLQD
jgi:hypothetical protein